MSKPALSRAIREMRQIIIDSVSSELDKQEQELEFHEATIKGVLSKEYNIPEGDSVLNDMYDFIVDDMMKQVSAGKFHIKKNRLGKTIFTTDGSKSKEVNRYKLFNRWKTAMSSRFQARFKGTIGRTRNSNIARGGSKKGSKYQYKTPRRLSRALVMEHGEGHAYSKAAYPVIGAIFAGFNHPDMTLGGKRKILGQLRTVNSLKGFKLNLDSKKFYNIDGDFKGTFTAHIKLGDIDDNTLKSIDEQADLGKNGRVVDLLEDIALEYDSSPSTMKWVDQALTAAILEKGKKSLKKSSSVSTTYTNKKKEKKAKKSTPPSKTLRTAGGQFTSVMNIMSLLNAQIKQEVADNMGKGGALVYRTGRFAESVSVEKVTQSRQGALTAYYTYMKAPYQTFERGFAQGSLRRDPRKLISASIREIARETLNHKLGIRVRRV